MHSGLRRVAAAIGLALTGLLLAGCNATGTVVVQADDKMAVDVVVSGSDMGECPPQISSLSVAPQPTPDGVLACRVTGTVLPSELGQLASVTTAGEYQVVRVALQSDGSMRGGQVDLTFRFPGEVLQATSGQVEGNSVRITSAVDLDNGVKVVALSRPGPPDRVIWAAGGVVGTLLVVGAFWLVLRRGRRTPVPPTDAPITWLDPGPRAAPTLADPTVQLIAAEPPAAPAPDVVAQDHSVWAPPEDAGCGPVD
jgi:hypothetical protein